MMVWTWLRYGWLAGWMFLVLPLSAAPQFQQEITVEKPNGVTGRHAALLVFFLPEGCSGYNITDGGSHERGMKELLASGSRHEVLFNADPGEKLILNYFCDVVPVKTEEPVSGLLHEVATYNSVAVNSVEDFRRRWSNAEPQGMRLERQVYSGWNPFGSNADSLHIFRGFIQVSKGGEYCFYTASTDASAVLIDGKKVAIWPGRHGVEEGRSGKFGGAVKLEKGVHRFEYLQANGNPDVCYSIAAYRQPGEEKILVIPEALFSPVLGTTTGHLKNSAGGEVNEFSWQVTDQVDVDGWRMSRLVFKAFPSYPVPQWMVAGQHMSGEQIIWFSFGDAAFKVSLDGIGSDAMTQQVAIRRCCDGGRPDSVKEKKLITELLQFEQRVELPQEGYAFLCAALLRLQMSKEAHEFYRRTLAKAEQIDVNIWFDFFRRLVLAASLEQEKYEEAAMALQRFGIAAKSPEMKSASALEQARLQLYYMGNVEAAATFFKEVAQDKLSGKDLKDYRLLAADLVLWRDGLDEARSLYSALDVGNGNISERQKMQLGGVILDIRKGLARKKYGDVLASIDQLEEHIPSMRLQANLTQLRGMALLGIGKKRQAAICFQKLLRLEPAPQLSMSANDAKQNVSATVATRVPDETTEGK